MDVVDVFVLVVAHGGAAILVFVVFLVLLVLARKPTQSATNLPLY